MILPDVNVLIYAFRRDTPHHALCRDWLVGTVTGEARFGLSPLVLRAVDRLTPHPRLFVPPRTIAEAFGFCDDLLAQPHCEIVVPGARHWDIFRRLCVDTETRGARISDAWFAARAIEQGCDWITLDRDFARVPGLKWRVPGV